MKNSKVHVTTFIIYQNEISVLISLETSMHSSRMRTARLLTVSGGSARGVCINGGLHPGVCIGGGSAQPGVVCPAPGGRPNPMGLHPGGLHLGVCSTRGVCIWGGGVCIGGSAWGIGQTPSLRGQNSWHMLLAPTSLRVVVKLKMCKIYTAFQIFFVTAHVTLLNYILPKTEILNFSRS